MGNARQHGEETARTVMGERHSRKLMGRDHIRNVARLSYETGQRAALRELQAVIEAEIAWLADLIAVTPSAKLGARVRIMALRTALKRASVPS